MLLHYLYSLLGGGTKTLNGKKTDVKLSTHMQDVGMSMLNPLVNCAAKESEVSEGVRPCWGERESYLTTLRLDCGWQILVGTTSESITGRKNTLGK